MEYGAGGLGAVRALPRPGRQADDLLEDTREVTLLGEARGERDVRL